MLSVQEKKMNAMDEKVMFRIPGDELAAFKRRVAADGLTVSVFLRIA
jgi:predicted DNA binding CopG/RHH family protein